MVYKKYNARKRVPNRKRKYVGRRRFKRVGAKAGSMAYTAYKMARKLMDAVNIEYKYVDINDSPAPTTSGSYLATLNNISQGTTDQTRIGDSVKLQNLTLRLAVQYATQSSKYRVLVVWDKQAKVTLGSDILTNTGSALVTISPKNYDKRFQTKILFDYSGSVDANNPIRIHDIVLPINEHTQYEAASNTINTGRLLLMLVSDLNVNQPNVSYVSRLTFTDN